MESENHLVQELPEVKTLLGRKSKVLFASIISVFSIIILVFIGSFILPVDKDANKNTSTKDVLLKPESVYENPFDEDVQYVNPFALYKNPFDTLE